MLWYNVETLQNNSIIAFSCLLNSTINNTPRLMHHDPKLPHTKSFLDELTTDVSPSPRLPRRPLVGEASAGKASRSLAQHIPGQVGMEGMKAAAGGVVGDLARARIALDERGQRLGELEDRTAHMMTSAETFSKHAHEVLVFFTFLAQIANRYIIAIKRC